MSDLKEEERPESPPLGLLDPSRIQNPLASAEQHQQQQMQMQQQQNTPQHNNHPSEFVMPEQPRQQQMAQQQAPWQRTPTMSPANIFQQGGAGTPGSQRSSTGTPNHQMAQQQQQFFHGESPAHSQSTPMTPQSTGAAPGSACGTPQSAGPPGAPQHPNQPPYDYQAVQMQQQQQAQAMAAAQQQQQQHHQQQQQQQFAGQPGQMMDSPYRQHPQMMGMHPHPGAHQYPPGYHQQWQQQMYARQAQAQAAQQQRVVQQRIPYPPGAYPAGMPGGPQAPMTPVYPPPSPATRTTPGSAGPQAGPPGTPQRPQYPPGQNPQPPPQFAYPPPQQVTPTGQFPAGTPTFNSPAAHQMYRQGSVPGGMPNQVPPGAMRQQYISPQAQQQQPAPGTPHRFAPQTPSGTTSSPHFPQVGGPDLRSPTNTLMSPQQVMQAGSQQHTPHTPVLPRALHGEMAPAHQMRPIALPSQSLPPNAVPQSIGTPQPPLSSNSMGAQQFQFRQGPMPPQQGMPMHHDPNTFPMAPQPVNTDPELFLAGCSIHCFDVDRLIQDRLDRHNLEFIVKYHGGEIEFEEAKFAEQKNKITHVLVDSCRNPNVRRSLEERKRVVSMQWLVDVIERQKTEIPFKLAHLPSPFSDGFRPYLGKLFSLSGFDETERPTIAFMAEAMGAKITPFLARDNDLLIAKGPSEKVTKAQEWKVPVVNFQWIADSYVVSTLQPQDRPNVENPRYQLGQPTSDIVVQPSVIESASAEFGAMLRMWKLPVIIDEASYERAQLTRKNLQSDLHQFPNQRFIRQEPAPTDEEIKISIEHLEQKSQKKTAPQVTVYFGELSGLSSATLDILKKKVEFLGGKNSEDIQKATHVVLASGRRTVTLLEAICRGKNVMQPEWIVDSYRHKMWLDTFDYFLSDKKLENELSYNCKRSVLRARRHRVFEDIEFHVTRFVEPSQSELVRLIELAGGIVHPEAPEPKYLARCIESEQPFIIVSCENDVRSLGYLAESKLPIYNADLVLFAMLRQHIEPLPQYRIPISIVMKNQVFRQPPPYSAPIPAGQ